VKKVMEIRKIAFKKPLKLLTLLLTATLIASASAYVYYSLSLTSSTTTGAAPAVKFVSGDDTPSGSNVQDTWCWLKLSAYPNVTMTYDKAVNISNTGGVVNIRLRPLSIDNPNGTDSISNFTRITFYLRDVVGSVQGKLNYTTTGDSWNPPSATDYVQIPAGTQWTVKVETVCKAGASANIVTDIEIAVDVQS